MKNLRSRLGSSATVLVVAALAAAPAAQASPGAGAAPAAGTPTARALALMPARIKAGFDIRISYRRYALCAASNITPSKKTTSINGKKYTVGTGLCPIVTDWTVYNKSLQGTSPTVKGASTIWSSFGNPSTYAQYDPAAGTWSVAPATGRTYVVGASPNVGMANFWGFPCVVTTPVTINGTRYPMAMCAGPLMENIDNRPVSDGVTAFTNAPTSATIPVGLGKIAGGPLAGMETFFLNPFPAGHDTGGGPL
ncbi:MAG: hypothetical protein ACKOB9_01000 [Solirubrobacterales bacterium]